MQALCTFLTPQTVFTTYPYSSLHYYLHGLGNLPDLPTHGVDWKTDYLTSTLPA